MPRLRRTRADNGTRGQHRQRAPDQRHVDRAPRRWCPPRAGGRREDDRCQRHVPSASGSTRASPLAWLAKTSARTGTITSPPPTPNELRPEVRQRRRRLESAADQLKSPLPASRLNPEEVPAFHVRWTLECRHRAGVDGGARSWRRAARPAIETGSESLTRRSHPRAHRHRARACTGTRSRPDDGVGGDGVGWNDAVQLGSCGPARPGHRYSCRVNELLRHRTEHECSHCTQAPSAHPDARPHPVSISMGDDLLGRQTDARGRRATDAPAACAICSACYQQSLARRCAVQR